MISRRAAGVEASGIRKIFERVASMADPIDLSIGQPHFDVPEPVQAAAIAAMRAGRNRYTLTQGLPELNAAILARLAARDGYRGTHSLVTGGVSGGLLLGYLALLDPGDHLLLPDPYFTMYPALAQMVGAGWSPYALRPGVPLTEASLEAAVGPRTRAVLVNSPANPSGRVLGPAELDAVGAVAERHDLVVISDEIYDAFVYDGPHESAARHVDVGRLLLLGGFSKTYGMPGWRMGYAAGPEVLIEAMRRLQQFTFVCAPSVAQHACLAALEVDMSPQVAAYRRKRDRLVTALAGHYEFDVPRGSFYMYPRLPAGLSGAAFVERALAEQLLIVPGTVFSARDEHFRLSFAVSDELLERGIAALQRIAAPVRGR